MKKLKEKIKNKLGEKKTAKLKKSLHVARIVKNIVCWTLIAILTVAVVVFMLTKVSGGSPTLFGFSLHRIITGSMEPELMIGDVILSKEIKDPSDIGIGNIITFQGDARFDNQKVTHRVLVAPYDDGKGNLVLVTKGDANQKDDGVINYADVESKYLSKLDFLRVLYNFFFSTGGFLVFIFLLLLIFFDEIVNIIKLTIGAAKEEDTESFQEIVERVKREQLEEMKKKRAAEKEKEAKQNEASDSDESVLDDAEKSDLSLSEAPQPEEAETGEQPSEAAEAEEQPPENTDVEQGSQPNDADTIDFSLFEEAQPVENETGEEQLEKHARENDSFKENDQHKQKSNSGKDDTKTKKSEHGKQQKPRNNQNRTSSNNTTKKNSKKRKKR